MYRRRGEIHGLPISLVLSRGRGGNAESDWALSVEFTPFCLALSGISYCGLSAESKNCEVSRGSRCSVNTPAYGATRLVVATYGIALSLSVSSSHRLMSGTSPTTRSRIYRVSQEERSIFWVTILNKKMYMYVCPIPKGFRDEAILL
jgi:hypothetical protein